MSDVLSFTCQANKINVPVLQQPQLVYVLTEMQPGLAVANVRMPLNFALVLDRSGSMAGEKLRTMKQAVCNIIDQLDPSDIVSLITFETATQVLIPAQPAHDKEQLKRKVNSITDGGGTNMANGIREGLAQVSRNNIPGRTSRLVLLTDGEATDREDDSRREADNAGARGIQILGLGFGHDWKTDFMQDLADRSVLALPGSGAGFIDMIASPQKAVEIFNDIYNKMQVVAQNMVLTLRLVQGIEARRVWQVTPVIKDIGMATIQGRSVVIQIGDLEKTGVAYMVEMMLPPRQPGAYRIAQADVSYNVINQGMQRETSDLLLNYTYDPGLVGQVNGRVMNIVERVTAFKLQTQALNEAELGNVHGATQKLRQAVTILLNQGETDLARQMEQEASNLEQGGQISNEGKKTIRLESRKTVRLDNLP